MTEKRSHLVFVYGTLMQGYHNHVLLRKAVFLGNAQTQQKYRLTYTSFPMLTLPAEVQVKGELYQVSDEELAKLDILEGVPELYYRAQIPVLHRKKTDEAWAYFYTRGEGRYVIPSGNYRDARPRNTHIT